MDSTIADMRHKLALISMLLSIPGEQLTDGARAGGIILIDEIALELTTAGGGLGVQQVDSFLFR